MSEGVGCYREALLAINEFQRLIAAQCREVVRGKLAQLGAVVGATPGGPQDYGNFLHNPDSKFDVSDSKSPYLGWPWLAVKVELGEWEMFCGLYFGHKAGSQVQVRAALVPLKKLKQTLLNATETLKAKGYDFPDALENEELAYFEVLDAMDAGKFAPKLVALIEKWVTLFRDVHGLAGLTSLDA